MPVVSRTRALLLALAVLLAAPTPARSAPARNVLVLHSYHDGYSWTDALTEGIRAGLQHEGRPVELWIEYLDTQREPGTAQRDRVRAILTDKYRAHRPVVILAADDAAVEFLLDGADRIFPGVPVVFCGVNNPGLVRRMPRTRYTGLIEGFSSERMLALAHQLLPQSRRVFLVNDDTETGRYLRDVHVSLSTRFPALDFVVLDASRLTFADILRRLGDAAADDLVLTTQFHLDYAGTFEPADEGIRRMVAASRAPVLTAIGSDVTMGVLIGSENVGVLHGERTAAILSRVLAGTRPADIPVATDSGARLLVNATALEARRLRLDPLSPDAVLVNTPPPSFAREHAGLVAGTLAFIALQTFAIALLVANVRRRRGAERRLEAQARELETSNARLAEANTSLVAVQRERQRTEERLRQAQKMDAVGRLAGGVAHDFNNLLTVIRGYSDLVLDTIDEDDPVRSSVDEIGKAADRAASLTHQLLAFSRKQVLQPRVLDLNTVVADLQKMLQRLIGEDVELRTDLAPGLPRVKVDESEWQQVIVNLAVNARDAMPRGGLLVVRTSALTLRASEIRGGDIEMPAGEYVLLEVADTGTGMSKDVQARIFEPFFTTKERGKGVGLGLSTVYGIVKQSGGWIWVDSEPGHGTTFRLYLPASEVATDSTPAATPAGAASEASETVLLVEDQDEVRRLVAQVLRERGYVVLEASGGEEALALSASHPGRIALLLTDVVMPGMRGPEVAERVLAGRPTARVLYMSGYTDDVLAQAPATAPHGALLEKPFTPHALAARVREILDEQAA